ncbi:MAG: hypothetical protein IPI69_15730 [Bacteroidales bacterium]|nr:hypothetical protein [Bacteroidales bacterium]
MNRLMKEVAQERSEQNIIETIALRAMAKAVYSTDNRVTTDLPSSTTLYLPDTALP